MTLTLLAALFSLNAHAQAVSTTSVPPPGSEVEHFKKECMTSYTLETKDGKQSSGQYQTIQDITSWTSTDGNTVFSLIRSYDEKGTLFRVTSRNETLINGSQANSKIRRVKSVGVSQIAGESQSPDESYEEIIETTLSPTLKETQLTVPTYAIEPPYTVSYVKGAVFTDSIVDFGNGKKMEQSVLKTPGDFGSAGPGARDSSMAVSCTLQKL